MSRSSRYVSTLWCSDQTIAPFTTSSIPMSKSKTVPFTVYTEGDREQTSPRARETLRRSHSRSPRGRKTTLLARRRPTSGPFDQPDFRPARLRHALRPSPFGHRGATRSILSIRSCRRPAAPERSPLSAPVAFTATFSILRENLLNRHKRFARIDRQFNPSVYMPMMTTNTDPCMRQVNNSCFMNSGISA